MSVQIAGGPLLPAARRVRVFDDRDTWVEGRKVGLGSSDVAAILGVSPYRSGWDIYLERVLDRRPAPDARREKYYARGHREEPRILEDYADEVGAAVMPLRQVIVEGPAPLAVSPDSLVQPEGWGWGLGECKTDRTFAWGPSGTVIERWSSAARELVREDHAAQVYSQLIATGLPFAVLAVRRDMDDLRHFTLLADERLQARMLERLSEWWERHIVGREPPPNDGSEACAKAKERMYSGGAREKKTRVATPEEVALARELVAAKTEVQRLQDRERKLRSDLADAIGEGYGVHWEWAGGTSKALYIDVAGRELVDTEKLRKEHPEVFAKVAKVTEPSRQVRLYI